MSQKQSRYPGARPFEKAQQSIFFGREKDTQDLFNLMMVEQLVVLYGKSGTGKSSLLNAGVTPKIEAEGHYEPMRIRFTAWNPKEQKEGQMPVVTAQQVVRNGNNPAGTFLDKIISNENTLWHDVKEHQILNNGEKGLLLIFDQFEELFTYPDAAIRELRKQLAEALFTAVPQRYWDVLEASYKNGERLLTKEEATIFQERPGMKAVIAVRSDRLHLLNQLSDYLPAVLKHCYELGALSGQQVSKAIVAPALATGDFSCPPFAYEDAALTKIVNFLTQDGTEKVESTQLQIVCHSIEEKVERNGITMVTVENMGDLESIILNYYDERIETLDPKEQYAARILIEDHLIFLEERRRLSMYEGQVLQHISQDSLTKLVNSHLLRSEPSMQGGHTYELSHDTLVGPVLKARAKRVAEETKIAEEKAKREREQELAAERRKRRRSTILAVIGFALAALAIGAFLYANHQTLLTKRSARASHNVSLVFLKAKANPTLALRIAEYNLNRYPENPVVMVAFQEVVSTMSNRYNKTVFKGHEEYVWAVAFSPDGKTVLTGSGGISGDSKDNTAKLWDLSGKELQTFNGHSRAVMAAAFSPDGKMIATGSDDGTAKLWDLNGKEITTFTGHNNQTVTSIAFSPDGKTVLSGSEDRKAILWDLKGQLVRTFEGHQNAVSSVAFSKDGQTILTGSKDGTAVLWNTGDSRQIRTFFHENTVLSAVFSPDDKKVLTGCTDNAAHLWDIPWGKEILTISGHLSFVTDVAFTPDGKTLLTGSSDKTVKAWDMEGKELYSLRGHSSEIFGLAVSPDGNFALTGSWDKTAMLWDLNGVMVSTFNGHSEPVMNVAFSPDGKKVVTGSWDKTVILWDLSGKQLTTFTGHTDRVYSVAFSPDGNAVLTGSTDGTCRLWGMDGKEVRRFAGNVERVYAVAFAPDNKSILAGSNAANAVIFDAGGKALGTLSGHTDEVRAVSYFPKCKDCPANLLTGSWDKTAKMWDMTGKELLTFTGHEDYVNSVAVSPDGKTVLTASSDHTARLWDMTGKMFLTFTGHQDAVNVAAFSPDGKMVLTGAGSSSEGADQTVKLWDLRGREMMTFYGHKYVVTSATFSPDGKTVLSSSADKTAKLWLTPQALLEQKLRHFTLTELNEAGVQLEKEDLDKINKE